MSFLMHCICMTGNSFMTPAVHNQDLYHSYSVTNKHNQKLYENIISTGFFLVYG